MISVKVIESSYLTIYICRFDKDHTLPIVDCHSLDSSSMMVILICTSNQELLLSRLPIGYIEYHQYSITYSADYSFQLKPTLHQFTK